MKIMGEFDQYPYQACPYCGYSIIENSTTCGYCHKEITPFISRYPRIYYNNKSREGSSDHTIAYSFKIFELEEVSRNPLYDEKLADKRKEDSKRATEKWFDEYYAKQRAANAPKCPTCGSTNIKKISVTSKVAGAAMFGLLSRTARSQFCCNNCGYKW